MQWRNGKDPFACMFVFVAVTKYLRETTERRKDWFGFMVSEVPIHCIKKCQSAQGREGHITAARKQREKAYTEELLSFFLFYFILSCSYPHSEKFILSRDALTDPPDRVLS